MLTHKTQPMPVRCFPLLSFFRPRILACEIRCAGKAVSCSRLQSLATKYNLGGWLVAFVTLLLLLLWVWAQFCWNLLQNKQIFKHRFPSLVSIYGVSVRMQLKLCKHLHPIVFVRSKTVSKTSYNQNFQCILLYVLSKESCSFEHFFHFWEAPKWKQRLITVPGTERLDTTSELKETDHRHICRWEHASVPTPAQTQYQKGF